MMNLFINIIKSFIGMYFLFLLNANFLFSQENKLTFKLDNQMYSFTNAKAGIEKLKNGDFKVFIGLKDKASKVMLVISTIIEKGKINKAQLIDTNYQDISLVLRVDNLSLFIAPSVKLLKSDNTSSELIKNKDGRFIYKKRKRDKRGFSKLSRKQRIEQGKGVRVFEKMKGSSFYLYLEPKVINNEVVRLVGKFSGIGRQFARRSKKSGNYHFIKEGFFNIEVAK